MDRAVIDLGSDIFAHGQAYVALGHWQRCCYAVLMWHASG